MIENQINGTDFIKCYSCIIAYDSNRNIISASLQSDLNNSDRLKDVFNANRRHNLSFKAMQDR